MKNENKPRQTATTFQLILSSVFLLIPIVGGMVWTRATIENHETRITRNEKDIRKFDLFMTEGSRYTLKQGELHEARTKIIEKWIAEAPPDLYENMIEDKFEQVLDAIRTNREQILELDKKIDLMKK